MRPEWVSQGVGKVLAKQIRLADGLTPSSAYLADDVLSCQLWQGDSQAQLAAPLAYWEPTMGPPNFLISLAPTDTVALAPGVYTIEVIVERPSTGQSALVWSALIEVLPGPGSATPDVVYIQLEDLEVELPAISMYQKQFHDRTGFAAQRARARATLDELCHRNARFTAGITSNIYPSDWPYRILVKSPVLDLYLRSNYLWITRPLIDHQVAYTLSLVFRGQIPANPEVYGELADRYQVRAENALRGCTGQIMGPGTGGLGAGTIDGTLLALVDFSGPKVLRA